MFHTMQEIIWPANELLASQEELCYIELFALYRVSRQECARIRENVPLVKIRR